MIEVGTIVYHILFSNSINYFILLPPFFLDYGVIINNINATEIQSYIQHFGVPAIIPRP